MQIQTYEIEEVKGELGNMAADSEAIELIQKLGLTGQQQLCDTTTDTRFPYPEMTSIQHVVFSACFPQVTRLEDFRQGIIPLRVLQVAAYCKENPLIHHLEVWHTQDIRKDPILVGRKTQYGQDCYLLARWGDALEEFEVLSERAIKIVTAKVKANLLKIRSEVDRDIQNLEESVTAKILEGQAVSAYYHGI